MHHVLAVTLAFLWIAANFYLWSLRQDPVVLFWESLGMAAVAFPAFGWYVKRSSR